MVPGMGHNDHTICIFIYCCRIVALYNAAQGSFPANPVETTPRRNEHRNEHNEI